MKLKTFFINSKNIARSSFIWNTIAGMVMALQSVIMLMILTRVTDDLSEAGVFTIAYANANLFLNIGKYGMRRFQASDTAHQFPFEAYLKSRVLTVLAMVVASAVYVLFAGFYNQYSVHKSLVIAVMCLYKTADAVEDVFAGHYQRENRLDIGAKVTTIRTILSLFVFACCLILFRDLLVSLVVATLAAYAFAAVFIRWSNTAMRESFLHSGSDMPESGVKVLLFSCFPLFAGMFLLFYISNSPKYAIDAVLNDEMQACYGFISMPVFIVQTLNDFVFFPVIYKMSQLWAKKEYGAFVKRLLLQIGIVAAISLACWLGAYLLGIPVLSVMYQTDLTPYKTELSILMIGSGFLGLSGLLGTFITIIRRQKQTLLVYAIVSLGTLLGSKFMVRSFGITGAAVLYTTLMAALCLGLGCVFLLGFFSSRKEKRSEV